MIMEWKAVIGYEGLYEVSSTGLIRSLNYKRSGIIKVMSPGLDKKGYYRTALMKSGQVKTIKVHREVAKAFIDNPDNKGQVNHINGIKTDNSIKNLEWCTNKENSDHAASNGLKSYVSGDRHGKVVVPDSVVLEMKEKIKFGYAKRAIAREYGVDRGIFKRKVAND